VIYSAWRKVEAEGIEHLFIPGRELPPFEAQHSPGLQLVKLFEATSHNDAMRQYDEWQGWGPYKPMLDADGNEYPEDNGPHPQWPNQQP
jgi:hypothetical protein